MKDIKTLFVCSLLVLLTASCAKRVVKPEKKAIQAPCVCSQTSSDAPIQLPDSARTESKSPVIPPPLDYAFLQSTSWTSLDGFNQDELSAGWDAWLKSCSALKNKAPWQNVCTLSASMGKPDKKAIAQFFAEQFDVYAALNPDGTDTGLITGYYEPLLKGSRKKSSQYPHPLYKQPPDLVTVELAEVYPELKNKRVRGKLVGNKLLPYMTRAEIENTPSPLAGNELLWVNDIIDAFFLQIQGSGLVQLENGESVHVGYVDQNGHSYQSIGRLLIERGELTAEKASMQGIKDWARNNLDKLRDLLNSNPSYVFFRELPVGLPGPLGALGVPITTERSVAIDPRYIPLGAPIFLSTTRPNSNQPLKRLMMAQDTGGAIKGGVRADFFWGAGYDAGKQAGAMKQQGKIWVLLPKGFPLPAK